MEPFEVYIRHAVLTAGGSKTIDHPDELDRHDPADMIHEICTRSIQPHEIAEGNDEKRFTMLAVPFNKPSKAFSGINEEFAAHAFDEFLSNGNSRGVAVPIALNHEYQDPSKILASTGVDEGHGSARFVKKPDGLYVEASMIQPSVISDHVWAGLGTVFKEASIRFMPLERPDNIGTRSAPFYRMNKSDIIEVSLVHTGVHETMARKGGLARNTNWYGEAPIIEDNAERPAKIEPTPEPVKPKKQDFVDILL